MSEPIRVLQVIGSMNRGGSENFIMNIYRNIDRSKVQFDFLVCTKEKAAFDDEIVSLGGKIFREISYLNSKNILIYQSLCDNFFEKHHYKIVHCHMGSVAQFVLRAAKKNGAVTVSHSHSAGSSLRDRILYIPISKHSDYLMACSEEAAVTRFGKENINNYKLVNNCLDVKKFSFDINKRNEIRKQLNIQNQFVIGHIGNFLYPKNHSFLIDVFSEILKIKPDSYLLLAGGGELENDIKEKCAVLNISDRVIFLGVINNTNDYLNAFDVFVFPSHFEGLPLSVVEAQTNGVKCLLSDNISKQTAVTDLVEFYSLDNSAADWAKKILSYKNYEHKDTSSQIKNAGYDASRQAKELEEFYLSL